MASTDVSIRFSVQDSQVVRKALEDLGKDGEAALRKFNAAGQAPSSGLKAISDTVAGLKERVLGLAVPLGPLGSGLIALGPAGIAAAAGIGALVSAISFMQQEASRMGEQAIQLQKFQEVTGISVTQMSALSAKAADLGLNSEQVSAGIERMTSMLDDAHRGAGALYEQLLRINPALADELAQTKTAAQAWDVLAKAYKVASDSQRALLDRTAFGRGNQAVGLLLGATADAGGINAVTAAMRERLVITDENAKKWADLKLQINDTEKHARDLMASLWTSDVLQKQREAAELMDRMAKRTKEMADAAGGSWWSNFWQQVGQGLGGQQMVGATPQPIGETSDDTLAQARLDRLSKLVQAQQKLNESVDFYKRMVAAPDNAWADQDARRLEIVQQRLAKVTEQIEQIKREGPAASAVTVNKVAESVPMPGTRPGEAPQDPEKIYNDLRRMMAILGPAASALDQIKFKEAEVNALVAATGGKYQEAGEKAKLAYTIAINGAQLNQRVLVGVASDQEIWKQQLDEIAQKMRSGIIKSTDDLTASYIAAQKAAEGLSRASQIAGAQLPQLKALELDSGNLRKQFDEMGSTTAQSFGTFFVDFASGAKNAGDAFKNLGVNVERAILNMIANMLIVAPIARMLQSILGGFGFGGGGTNWNAPGGPGTSREKIDNVINKSAVGGGPSYASNVIVHVHEGAGGDKTRVSSVRRSGGDSMVDIFTRGVNDALGSGRTDQTLKSSFGAKRPTLVMG